MTDWLNLFDQTLSFVKEASPHVLACQNDRSEKGLPLPDYFWYNPLTKASFFSSIDSEKVSHINSEKSLRTRLSSCDTEPGLPPGVGQEPWVPVKMASALRPLFSALQLVPNAFNRYVGGPTPIASSLAGGLLGAGLGYGAGWVGEKLMGEGVLRPGRLRRTSAILGGLLGMAPGAYLGSIDMRRAHQEGRNPFSALIEPNSLYGREPPLQPEASAKEALKDLSDVLTEEVSSSFLKSAEAGADYMPMIPVDAFNRVIWSDPNTSLPLKATVSGLVDAAAQSRGGAEVITPFDVGRIAIGMGSGLVSGMVVGRVLGALAGLTPQAQNTLQQTGM